jgi:hypothetical protein
MDKITKKEMRQSLEDAIRQTLLKFELSIPSKKTQKLLESSSRKIAEQIKSELKKKSKKTEKTVKSSVKKTTKKQALAS